MDAYSHLISVISLAMGAAWASGINLYATILVLGVLGSTGNMTLPAELQILQNPVVISAAGLMFVLEFIADKIPGIDSGWDLIQTFIRIPAGAVLAASAVGPVNPALVLTAGILGGTIAAGTHATKAGTRILINTSPEPFSNWTASLIEDLSVIAGLWIALHHPLFFLLAFAIFVALVVWLLPKIWRGIKLLASKIAGFFGNEKKQNSASSPI